jgi:hypothetical protein
MTIPLAVFRRQFIDVGPVEGLQYRTDSNTGVTDATGQFEYLQGEHIVFSIGDIDLPGTAAKSFVTAMDVFTTLDTLNPAVVNLNRLLFTLDDDGEIDNGIQISELASDAAFGLQLDFTSRGFEDSIINLVANSGAVRTSLDDTSMAVTAFGNSLEQQSVQVSECTSTHPRVGTSAVFVTLFHGVSGTLHVLDDCTLEINDFTYDRLGPSVFFYAGQNRVYEGSEVFYFPFLLTGIQFDNDRLRLRIPEGKSLNDFDSLSVWCFDVRVNFGDAYFEI